MLKIDNDAKKVLIYDYIRVFATILVVIGHCFRMYTADGVIVYIEPVQEITVFTKYIYSFHMPLFFFMSGSLFGYQRTRNRYGNFLCFCINKAKRILVPYLAFGILYVTPTMTCLHLTNMSFTQYIVEGILLSYNSRHLWFLLAVFWMYLVAFGITENRYYTKIWYIVLGLSLLLYCISSKIPSALQLSSACRYFLFFYLGITFEKIRPWIESIKTVPKRIGGGLILIVHFLLFTFSLSTDPLSYVAFIFNLVMPLLGIASTTLFCSLLCGKIKNVKIFRVLNKNSFGIYLFHPMIIYTIFSVGYKSCICPSLFSLGVIIASIVLSIGMTLLLRKMGLAVLIGENTRSYK